MSDKGAERPARIQLIPSTILARMTIWVWGAYSIWQGWGIIADGQARFSDPIYAALNRTPEPTHTWGTVLIVSGALMLLGSVLQSMVGGVRRKLVGFILKAAGCFGLAVWCVTFAIGSWLARDIPTSSGTAARTYATIAVSVLILVFIDERKAVRRHGS